MRGFFHSIGKFTSCSVCSSCVACSVCSLCRGCSSFSFFCGWRFGFLEIANNFSSSGVRTIISGPLKEGLMGVGVATGAAGLGCRLATATGDETEFDSFGFVLMRLSGKSEKAALPATPPAGGCERGRDGRAKSKKAIKTPSFSKSPQRHPFPASQEEAGKPYGEDTSPYPHQCRHDLCGA